jgi:hypothetical protein
MKRRTLAAVLAAGIALGCFTLTTGTASAWHINPGTPTVVVQDNCDEVATFTFRNPAWTWGSSADAVVLESSHPELVAVGTHVSTHTPLVVVTPITEDVTLSLTFGWVGEKDTFDVSETATFVDSDCTVVTTSTTVAPTTTTVAPTPKATPAKVVESTPVVTG